MSSGRRAVRGAGRCGRRFLSRLVLPILRGGRTVGQCRRSATPRRAAPEIRRRSPKEPIARDDPARSGQPIQWAWSEWAVAPDWIESPGNTTYTEIHVGLDELAT